MNKDYILKNNLLSSDEVIVALEVLVVQGLGGLSSCFCVQQ